MSFVFVSYSSRDRAMAGALVANLEAQGFPVWWDKELEAWDGFEEQIRRRLEEASAVVVVWSEAAARSDFVRAEVQRARAGRKLVSLRAPHFPVSEVPSPYNAVDHILPIDLTDLAPVLRSVAAVTRVGGPDDTRRPLHEIYRDQFGIELVGHKREPPPTELHDISPCALLQARYEFVPFVDTTGMLTEILAWCRSEGPASGAGRATAGRLLHGPGGVGKTRLMIEAARILRESGWLAGFCDTPRRADDVVEEAQRTNALAQIFGTGEEAGVLLVLDYAEARQGEISALARLLRARPRTGVRPVRVVLLARGDAWWREFYGGSDDIEILFQRFGQPYGEVKAIEPPAAGAPRVGLFNAILAAYRPVLARVGAVNDALEGGPPDTVARERIACEDAYARPLALQMEALIMQSGHAAAGGIAGLLERVLQMERRHWRKVVADLSGNPDKMDAMRRAITNVTLVGGVDTRRTAEDLLVRDTHYGEARAPADLPIRELRQLYGAGPRDGIAALEPDLLGEHEAAHVADHRLVAACFRFVDALPAASRAPRRRTLLTVLQRASREEHGAARQNILQLLSEFVATASAEEIADAVSVAIATPGQLGMILAQCVQDLEANAFDALEAALPERTVALIDCVCAVVERRLCEAREAGSSGNASAASKARLANALRRKGTSLHLTGAKSDALKATQDSVALYRELSATTPTERGDLARALSRLSRDLAALGKRQDSLTAIEEANRLYASLGNGATGEETRHHAEALTDEAVRLSSLGRLDDALAVARRSRKVWERLACADADDACRAGLARSYLSIGERLLHLGRAEEALQAHGESVALYRRLAARNADAFTPNLSSALDSVAKSLSANDDCAGAFEAMTEAVALRRQLAQLRPHAFEGDYANSLLTLGMIQAELGAFVDAHASTAAAYAIFARLEHAFPGSKLHLLAWATNNLGLLALTAGDIAKARRHIRRGELVRRRLVRKNAAFRPDLTQSLSNRAIAEAAGGAHERARDLIFEGEALCRTLFKANGQAFTWHLTKLLTTKAQVHLMWAEHAVASEAAREAMAVLATVDPSSQRHLRRYTNLAEALASEASAGRTHSAPTLLIESFF